MMLAKLSNPGLIKINVFQNMGYDAISPDYEVTNKVLSCKPNDFVDVVLWPKFRNSSISMTEIIIIL